jgi:hypothetical protein
MAKAKIKKQVALPNWLNEKIDEPTRVKIKEATFNYICENDLMKKLPHPNTDLYWKILPHMVKIDVNWGVVTQKVFNTGKFPAIETYGHAIRNYLMSKSLKQALKDKQSAIYNGNEKKEDQIYISETEDDVSESQDGSDDFYHKGHEEEEALKEAGKVKSGELTPMKNFDPDDMISSIKRAYPDNRLEPSGFPKR